MGERMVGFMALDQVSLIVTMGYPEGFRGILSHNIARMVE
jgi:hypothetical protein